MRWARITLPVGLRPGGVEAQKKWNSTRQRPRCGMASRIGGAVWGRGRTAGRRNAEGGEAFPHWACQQAKQAEGEEISSPREKG